MTTHTLFGRLLALLLAIMLTVPGTAWAADAEAEAAATEYYNQATVAYQAGDYQKAADLLDLAFGANADMVYKYNRILALQALGDFDTALAELNTMYGPMKADHQNRFDDIDQIKAQIEASIAARDGAQTTEPVETKPEEPAEKAKSGPNIPAIALIGGGGVALTTGLLFATAVFLPADVKECRGIGRTPNCEPLRDDGESVEDVQEYAKSVQSTHQIISITLMSVGVVAAAVGVVLLVMDGGDASESAPPASAGLDSLRFTPYVSTDGGGAAFQMRF